MSNNPSKKDRPLSSKADMANFAVGIAQYSKLKNIEAGTNELIKQGQVQIEIAKRQETLLDSVDLGIRNLEALAEQKLEIEKTSLEFQEKNYELRKLDSQKDDARYELDRLEKQQKELKEQEIQSFKDITYQVFREHQKIDKETMSNLERLYTLEKLNNILQAVDTDILNEKVDKEFCDQTKDALSEKIESVKAILTKQDKSDLKTIIEIEREDENEHASKLLNKINAQLMLKEEVSELMAQIKNKKKLSNNDSDEIQKKIAEIRKKAKSK